MKTKNKYLALFFISLFLAGCSKNDSNNTGETYEYNASNSKNTAGTLHGELIRACSEGKYKKVETLLKNGANINEYIGTETNQITPLIAAIVSNNPDIAKLLIREGAGLDQKYEGYSAKEFAFYNGNYEIVDLILNKTK